MSKGDLVALLFIFSQDTPAQQRIAFQPGNRLGRNKKDSSARQRSASSKSISNIRSRTRSVSGIPVEFRSLTLLQ
ncbi:hypothetical protein WAI453_003664 [Rhynchosporium graminicola]